jgi:hypothetical protein
LRSAAAEVVSAVLLGIRAVDPVLATWRKQGGSRAQALAQPMIDPSPDAIEARLTVNRTDVGREPIPELGFGFDAWTGASDPADEAAVSARVGLHAQNPNLQNRFVATLPTSWEERDPRLHSLVKVLVESLHPDEAVYFGPEDRIVLWSRE